jgi:nucleosome assembly protein 1-like 1
MRQLDTDFQIGFTIHESIIPQAVLWFTGEAEEADNSEYDPEEDEECEEDDSEEDDDEDYEEESDEENVPVQKKKSGKQQGKKKFPALEPGANTEKPPECKNQ